MLFRGPQAFFLAADVMTVQEPPQGAPTGANSPLANAARISIKVASGRWSTSPNINPVCFSNRDVLPPNCQYRARGAAI